MVDTIMSTPKATAANPYFVKEEPYGRGYNIYRLDPRAADPEDPEAEPLRFASVGSREFADWVCKMCNNAVRFDSEFHIREYDANLKVSDVTKLTPPWETKE